MSSPAQARSDQSQAQFLDQLRQRYEEQGFLFTVYPERSMLPAFFGSYTPDAIASKAGRNVAIEVKRRPSSGSQLRLQEIRRLFDGQPDWELQLVHMGSGPLQSVRIAASPPGAIRSRVDEVRKLIAEGHKRAAFVIAWSLLEAALQAAHQEGESPPRTPGTVVQTLAMNGYIPALVERRMRELIQLRNRIVHGDVAAEPGPGDVEAVLSAVEETLMAAAK